MRSISMVVVAVAVLSFGTLSAWAGYKEDIGFTKLQDEMGDDLPTGAGVKVAQAEAYSGSGYMPDVNHSEFDGKTFTNVTGSSDAASWHATNVGKYFYGNSTSMAPGINEIDAYSSGNWMGSGFIKPHLNQQPLFSNSRVANHSWVGNYNYTYLARVDWVVETDDFIQVVGVNNGSTIYSSLSGAYNVISIGVTDGDHAMGTNYVGGMYTSGRTKPDLVAPTSATSWSTAIISSASALLVGAGHDGAMNLSNGYLTSTRTGMTIYHAETSEVVKASLMAGADRRTNNSSNGNITDYTIDTNNSLDHRFGAGQVNVYNSYHIIATGEQNSVEDGGPEAICYRGFDYDPSFTHNDQGSYFFTANTRHDMIMTSLVWNLDVDGGTPGNFNATGTLFNLNLHLYDVTDSENHLLVAESTSANENTENLYVALECNNDYMLLVQPEGQQDEFDWDYGFAWQIVANPDTYYLDGDLDGDGLVGQGDLFIILDRWGETVIQGVASDPSEDGFVEQRDLSIVLNDWGKTCDRGPIHAPEPGTMILLSFGAVSLLRRRRKA